MNKFIAILGLLLISSAVFADADCQKKVEAAARTISITLGTQSKIDAQGVSEPTEITEDADTKGQDYRVYIGSHAGFDGYVIKTSPAKPSGCFITEIDMTPGTPL